MMIIKKFKKTLLCFCIITGIYANPVLDPKTASLKRNFILEEYAIPLQVERVKKVLDTISVRKKIVTAAGVVGGALLFEYYNPGLLTSLICNNKPAVEQKIFSPQELQERYNVLTKTVEEHKTKIIGLETALRSTLNRNKGFPYAVLDHIKRSLPLLLASSVFSTVTNYISYIKAICFPVVSLSWFVALHTRYPSPIKKQQNNNVKELNFMTIIEDLSSSIENEHDLVKRALMVEQYKTTFIQLLDHGSLIIGYMMYVYQHALLINIPLARSLKTTTDRAFYALKELSQHVNDMHYKNDHIPSSKMVSHFRQEFDAALLDFIVYEAELKEPSMIE